MKDHLNLGTARMVFVKNAAELTAVIKSSKPRRLVYYGHAVLGSKALLPSIGQAVEVWSLVEMLKHSSVTDFDILGCNGTSIAADLSIHLPGVRVGYLRAAREDNLVVDLHTLQVKELHFDDQTLRHFPAR